MVEDSISYTIVALTSRHSITGELLYREQRLSDFLNDRRDTVISLRNVQVARLNEPGKILQQHPAAVVPKAWVLAIFEPPQKEIPQTKRFYGYVRKVTHEVFLVMEGMEIRGTLHTTADLDLRRILTSSGESFLPLTKAVVTLDANERYIIEQDAIMVNTSLIRYIAKVKVEQTPPPTPIKKQIVYP
ncbi:MAG TPA: hypothetical protein VF478_07205 [Anaerolineae bacterium]